MKAVARITGKTFRTDIRAGIDLEHKLVADEPTDKGGENAGPTAMELLAAALGACTVATLRSYANIKGLELEGVEVDVDVQRRKPSEQQEAGEGAKATVIRKKITIKGDKLTNDQRVRMLEIAEKCPVNKALLEGVDMIKDQGASDLL
ncbi:MAG: OsmC family protein [Planctomycetes bacterium]|nr:OsmC family protein [Planctomycetota bacterium]